MYRLGKMSFISNNPNFARKLRNRLREQVDNLYNELNTTYPRPADWDEREIEWLESEAAYLRGRIAERNRRFLTS